MIFVEVLNSNYDHGVFHITQLCLEHIKQLGHNYYNSSMKLVAVSFVGWGRSGRSCAFPPLWLQGTTLPLSSLLDPTCDFACSLYYLFICVVLCVCELVDIHMARPLIQGSWPDIYIFFCYQVWYRGQRFGINSGVKL